MSHRRHDRLFARFFVRQFGDSASLAQHKNSVGAFEHFLKL